MNDLELVKIFEEPDLRFYLDSRKHGNENAVKELISFVHSGGEMGIRHNMIKRRLCPSRIKNPNQLDRYLKELVNLRLFQPIMKNEPGPRAKKKEVKPSVYYRVWKGFLTRPKDPGPDEIETRAREKESKIALRYVQLRDANERLEAAKALMKTGGPYEDPDREIDRLVEAQHGVKVEPSTAADLKQDVEWNERFYEYCKKLGVEPGEMVVFEHRILEWQPLGE